MNGPFQHFRPALVLKIARIEPGTALIENERAIVVFIKSRQQLWRWRNGRDTSAAILQNWLKLDKPVSATDHVQIDR